MAEEGEERAPAATVDPDGPTARSETSADAEGSSDPPRPDRRRRWQRALRPTLAALLVVVLVVTAAVAVAANRRVQSLEHDRDRQRQVERSAAVFGEALLSYDYRDLEGTVQRVLRLSTPQFAAQYEEAFDGGLSVLITEVQGTATAEAKDVYVGEVGPGRAVAIVVLDSVVDGTTGQRTRTDSYVRLVLRRRDEAWKVDEVTNLNFGPPSTPSPTTTAPPALAVPPEVPATSTP